MKKRIIQLAVVAGGTLLLGLVSPADNAQAAALSPADCIKCHDSAPQDIATNGGAHKEAVTCVECHEGHAPLNGEDIIPSCNKCHEGEPHFELPNCSSCHNNPHTPKIISLEKNITDACLTCHTEQMGQLQQYQSSHTAVACSTCHREKHGLIPDCTNCHSPHSEEMVQKDCLTCHQAHMPLEVTYPNDIASSNCAGCHDKAYDQLTTNPAKHSKLSCATCHQDKHKMIPQCADCHGNTPHPSGILTKFPECGQCHGIAHDLNK